MAAASSRIRSLTAGTRRTRAMRTTAKKTAAPPPATTNRTRFGSTNPLPKPLNQKTARSERVYEPSTEHAPPPPDHDPDEHHQARHQDAGDEDERALVLLRERQREGAAGLGRDGDERVLFGQPLKRRQREFKVGVAVVGRQGAVLGEPAGADDHDPRALGAGRLLERFHYVERSGGIACLAAEVLHRARLGDGGRGRRRRGEGLRRDRGGREARDLGGA